MRKTMMRLGVLLIIVLLPAASFALPVDYAHLSYGASIYSVSSTLPSWQGYADARDVIGGRDVSPPGYSSYFSGETGNFIFGMYDWDQTIIVDLGTVRSIDRVGGSFSPYPNDREVWDYFGVSLALDNPSSFFLVGSVGTKGDGIVDVTASSVYFDLASPVDARYVKYEFGEYSHDWGGGSRVYDVYAGKTTPTPEPATTLLLGGALIVTCGWKKKKKEV